MNKRWPFNALDLSIKFRGLIQIFSGLIRGLIQMFSRLIGGLIQMKKRILPFLNDPSKSLTVVFAGLAVIASFFIWDVTRKQAEISRLLAESEVQPIIQTDYTFETLHEHNRRKGLGDMGGRASEIVTIELSNIGRGTAHNLEIKHRGQDTVVKRELRAGEKYDYLIFVEAIRTGRISMVADVRYQDRFGNEFTTETPEFTTIPEP